MDRPNFIKSLKIENPILKEWEESGKIGDFKTYFRIRSELARKNGFKSAYDEYEYNSKATEGKEPSVD